MAGWDYNSIAVAKYFFYRYGFQDPFIVPMCTCTIKLSNKENFENKEKSRSRYCISQSTSPAVPVLISALDRYMSFCEQNMGKYAFCYPPLSLCTQLKSSEKVTSVITANLSDAITESKTFFFGITFRWQSQFCMSL